MAQKILDLQGMVVLGGIDLGEARAILRLELCQQVLFTGYRPHIVQRRLGDVGHSRYKRRPTVRLHSH